MPEVRLSLFVVLLAVFITAGSPLLAQADAGDRVITTDRLNLRTCPSTSECRVLRTLPLDTSLKVIERRDEWLQVMVLEDEASGWVHSSYTQVVERRPPLSMARLLSREFLAKAFVAVSLLGAFLVTGYVGPRRVKPGVTGAQFFTLSVFSVLLGAVVLLNQFGPVLAALSSPYLQLDKVSIVWEINAAVESHINYSHVVLFLAAAGIGVVVAAPAVNGCKISFLQGVCTGFSALPVMAATLFLAGILCYVMFVILKVLGFLIGIIAVPFVWIWEHALLPILRLLSIPLIWLWENVLRAVVEFLAVPFVWLWEVILRPVLGFVVKFVLAPLLILVTGIAAALLALFPLGVVGAVILESLRSATRGSLNALGLFSQGVAIGFLLFDATLLAGLNAFDLLHTVPPLSLLIPVALQVIVFLRLLGSSDAVDEACPIFRDKLRFYWSSSQLELLSACVLIPVGLLALFYGEDN